MDLMYTLPAVIGQGALHSLEPSHRKGVITAYLISSGAKIKDAISIGLISALAHTLSITLIALSASSAVKVIVPENLIHWFQLISGIVVIYIGLNIITQRFFDYHEAKKNNSWPQESNNCTSHCILFFNYISWWSCNLSVSRAYWNIIWVLKVTYIRTLDMEGHQKIY